MRYIIADLPAILKNPRLLGGDPNEIQIVIPFESIEYHSALNSDYGKAVWEVIKGSTEDKHVRVVTMNDPEFSEGRQMAFNTGLIGSDLATLTIALTYKMKQASILVATESKLLKNVCEKYGIDLFGNQIIQIFKSQYTTAWGQDMPDEEIRDGVKDVTDLNLKESKRQLLTIMVSVPVSVAGVFFFQNINSIVASVTVWGTIVILLLASIFLFKWRGKEQMSYGAIEFFVGFVYAIVVLNTGRVNLADTLRNTEAGFKLIGCLYIMVRGIDNFMKGVPTSPLPNQLSKWMDWLVLMFHKIVRGKK